MDMLVELSITFGFLFVYPGWVRFKLEFVFEFVLTRENHEACFVEAADFTLGLFTHNEQRKWVGAFDRGVDEDGLKAVRLLGQQRQEFLGLREVEP